MLRIRAVALLMALLTTAWEASENFPSACGELLNMIRELYDVEREVP